MNARQKAKKYKRMYEKLLKSPVKFKVEQHKIDTLSVERFYPEELIMQENSGYLREVITKDIAQFPSGTWIERNYLPNSVDIDDDISRQWLMECVNEGWIKFDTEKDKNIFIHLIRDIAPSVQYLINTRQNRSR